MAKIKFTAVGHPTVELKCEDGVTCSEALEVFERLTGKIVKGMDLFSNGSKIRNLDSEAPDEIIALKAKNESAK